MGFPAITLNAHALSVVLFIDCGCSRRLDLDIVYIGARTCSLYVFYGQNSLNMYLHAR